MVLEDLRTLNWISSFLSNRAQYVVCIRMYVGDVPQTPLTYILYITSQCSPGYCVGTPIICSLYINDIANYIYISFPCCLFADDCIIYK